MSLCTACVSEDGVFTHLITVYRAPGVGQACSRSGWTNMSETAPDREKPVVWWKDRLTGKYRACCDGAVVKACVVTGRGRSSVGGTSRKGFSGEGFELSLEG